MKKLAVEPEPTPIHASSTTYLIASRATACFSSSWVIVRRSHQHAAHVARAARAKYAVKRAAAAPSITRWSYDSDSGSIEPRHERVAVPHRLRRALRHAEDRDFGRVDDRRERGAADAAERSRSRSMPPCMSAGPSLPSRAFAESSPISFAIASTPFWSAFLITGTTRPFGVSAAKPMLKYCLWTRLSPSQRGVEVGKLLQRATRGLDQEREHRHLDAALLVLLVERDAQRLELGDVGFVELRDVRDHHPVAREVGAGDLPDARQRLRLDRPELREVDLRPRQEVERAAAGDAARGHGGARAGHAPASRTPARLPAGCGPSARCPLTRARSTPSSRANLRTDGDACAAANAPDRPARPSPPTPLPQAGEGRSAASRRLARASGGERSRRWRRGLRRAVRRAGAAGAAAAAGADAGVAAASPRRLQRQHHAAFAHLVADLDPHVLHDARRPATARPSSPCRIRA